MTPVRRAYERHVLPWLIALAMRSPAIAHERARLLPRASGRVVEIGVGSGLNLPFYGEAVDGVIGLDPSIRLLGMTRQRAARAPFPVELVQGSAEHLPLRDGVAGTVVSTWTLCSLPDPDRALREVGRVLKPDGRLLFVEHGRAPDSRVRAWQDRLTPAWSRLAGGCHLNRAIPSLVAAAGFRIIELEVGYGAGPRPLSYLYRGLAEPEW
jgi:ubiquinone/menaquinone biosynthesis C-methylase UbiE